MPSVFYYIFLGIKLSDKNFKFRNKKIYSADCGEKPH